MYKKHPLQEKSLNFAVHIVNVCKTLQTDKKEYIATNQLMRSGTSIGANVTEARHAQSKPDWYAKMKIADKEANESKYWIEVLHRTGYIDAQLSSVLLKEIEEIIRIIVSSCITAQKKKAAANNT